MKSKSLFSVAAIAACLLSTNAFAGEDTAVTVEKVKSEKVKSECKSKHKGYMKHIDRNKDGAITRAEFMDAAEKRFTKMDKNGDGVLDKADFEHKRKDKDKDKDKDVITQ